DFGLGPLEAGGWGVPTVAWKHGGPTVTVEDGVTGFLAKPYQTDDYAAKIRILLQDRKKRAKMGQKAWERTRDKFSWEVHLIKLDEEIKKVIG
ncbi:glycosyltransferase, partial [Patescibacteria group bacterium]|nr:glycosyltransferase [Patescibacteria group bacterium]